MQTPLSATGLCIAQQLHIPQKWKTAFLQISCEECRARPMYAASTLLGGMLDPMLTHNPSSIGG